MSGTKSGFSQPAIGEGPAPKRVGLFAARDFLEIRFSGTAAQGVILMGLVVATAATRDHRYVTQTQTHSPEEGDDQGLAQSDVIISDDPVDYPDLLGADLVVALCQGAADTHVAMLRPAGVFVYDSEQVLQPPCFQGTSYGIPFGLLAREAAGTGETSPALVALGASVAITGITSADSLHKTLEEMELAGSSEERRSALDYGLALDTKQWLRRTECS